MYLQDDSPCGVFYANFPAVKKLVALNSRPRKSGASVMACYRFFGRIVYLFGSRDKSQAAQEVYNNDDDSSRFPRGVCR